jgi:hypothetical protein
MKRYKLVVLVLFLFVYLFCIFGSFLYVAVSLRGTSPSDLLLRCALLGYYIKEYLSQPPMPPPSEIFETYILNPIPESVMDIKADKPKEIWGYTYTLLFNINRADLDMLIDSRPFQKVPYISYSEGLLRWVWKPGHSGSIIVYDSPRWRREPRWFRPEKWEDSEAYVFQKVGDKVNIQTFGYRRDIYDRMDTQVLIYNEKEGQAYFIVSSVK